MEHNPDREDWEWLLEQFEQLRAENRVLRERLQLLRMGRRVLLTLLMREAALRKEGGADRRPGGPPAGRAGRPRPTRGGDAGSTRIVPLFANDPDPAGQG